MDDVSGQSGREKTSGSPLRLKGRTVAVGSPSGFSPMGMVVFGLPFVAVGAWISLVGLEVIPVKASSVHAPMWVLTVCGMVFFLSGLVVWAMGISYAMRERVRKQHALLHPGQPAMNDYPWDSTGCSPPRWKPMWQGIGGATFMTVFLSVFHWWAFGSGDGPLMVKIIVGVFDLVLILVWWQVFQMIIHAVKFGKTRLVYSQFPYTHGDWFQARIELPSGLDRVDEARLVFRCVREYYETTGYGKNRKRRLVHEQLWAEEQTLSGAEIGNWPRFLNATFVIPGLVPGSNLRAKQPIFWELEMDCAVPGVDLKQRYLVPVYGRDFGAGATSG